MHILKRSLLLLGVTALTLTACKDDTVAPDTIAVTNITVSPPALTVQAGQTSQVSATVSTNGGTGTISLAVTWVSSNTAVAQVTNAGVVTAVAAGTATLTATSVGNTSYSASVFLTVTPIPALTNALLTFAVSPTAVSIVAGQTAPVASTETHATGATVSYVWSNNGSARCTVGAAGASQTITTSGSGAGSCVITVTATGSGTGLITNSIAQTVAVTITTSPTALLSLTVLPTSVNMVPLGTSPACVSGTNTVACQTVTTTTTVSTGGTVTFANQSSNTAVATVTAAGANPVITATGNGIAQITITATGTGTGLNTNSISATVQVNVQAASVSMSSLTTCLGGPPCVVGPVNLAGVLGQIEATLNINSGNQQIASAEVQIGAAVMVNNVPTCNASVVYSTAQTQTFGVNGAPTAPITLSVNTARFDPNTFAPLWLNGADCIRAVITPASGPAPNASNTFQFVLVNPDVVYYLTVAEQTPGITANAIGLNHTGNSAVGAGGFTWWRGGFTFRAHPVLYSGAANVTSIVYTSTSCGAAAGLPATTFSAVFPCAGFQGAQNLGNVAGNVTINYLPTYTLTVSPTGFMTAASPGFVPGSPVYAVNSTREDNVGPVTATPAFVNPGAGGWHGNGSAGALLPVANNFQLSASAAVAGTTYTVAVADGGVGVTAVPTINQINVCNPPNCAVATGPHLGVTAASGLPETLTPIPYQLQGTAVADLLGNGGTVAGPTGVFGVDLIVLDARYSDGLYPSVPAAVAAPFLFTGLNGSIYTLQVAAVAPALVYAPINNATDLIFVEAIDTRSGLNNPAAFFQAVRRFSAAGNVNCYQQPVAVGGTPDPLNQIQPTNNYVRNPLVFPFGTADIDCTQGVGVPAAGYYTWTGHIADRANNRKKPVRGGGVGVVMDSIWIAIDGALPNITGVGFQVAPLPLTYAGAATATYTFSANDDLELKEGQISLNYWGVPGPCGAPCASGTGVPFLGPLGVVSFPYGSGAYSTAPFGVPFDNVITNVINSGALTLNYYIVRYDFATLAAFVAGVGATGNVAGFGSSEIQSGVVANIRDVAFQQAAAPLVANIINTQITDRVGGAGGAPGYAVMIDFRILSKAGGVITVRDAAPTSVATTFCDRIDIYEAVNGVGAVTPAVVGMSANDPALGDDAGDGLRWRHTISTAPVLTDNGFQRFFTYAQAPAALPPGITPAGSGIFTAACVKSGSALLTPLF